MGGASGLAAGLAAFGIGITSHISFVRRASQLAVHQFLISVVKGSLAWLPVEFRAPRQTRLSKWAVSTWRGRACRCSRVGGRSGKKQHSLAQLDLSYPHRQNEGRRICCPCDERRRVRARRAAAGHGRGDEVERRAGDGRGAAVDAHGANPVWKSTSESGSAPSRAKTPEIRCPHRRCRR